MMTTKASTMAGVTITAGKITAGVMVGAGATTAGAIGAGTSFTARRSTLSHTATTPPTPTTITTNPTGIHTAATTTPQAGTGAAMPLSSISPRSRYSNRS